MRFLLVVAIWIVIVGGLYSYVTARDARRMLITAPVVADRLVEGSYSIELTPTFSTEKDPFALTTSSDEVSSLEVRFNGNALPYEGGELVRGESIVFEEIAGVLSGQNEIYVNASPPVSEGTLTHGVRVQFFQDATLLIDETIWGEQGAIVSGSVSYMHQVKGDNHDH